MDDGEKVCSICQHPFIGFGNNPEPLGTVKQRCCDQCNSHFVVPARIARLYGWSRRAASGETDNIRDLPVKSKG